MLGGGIARGKGNGEGKCKEVARIMQRGCKEAARRLQGSCKEAARRLQGGCKDVAMQEIVSM